MSPAADGEVLATPTVRMAAVAMPCFFRGGPDICPSGGDQLGRQEDPGRANDWSVLTLANVCRRSFRRGRTRCFRRFRQPGQAARDPLRVRSDPPANGAGRGIARGLCGAVHGLDSGIVTTLSEEPSAGPRRSSSATTTSTHSSPLDDVLQANIAIVCSAIPAVVGGTYPATLGAVDTGAPIGAARGVAAR
jgi:hypothetical protein